VTGIEGNKAHSGRIAANQWGGWRNQNWAAMALLSLDISAPSAAASCRLEARHRIGIV